jgi:hypothetical protein
MLSFRSVNPLLLYIRFREHWGVNSLYTEAIADEVMTQVPLFTSSSATNAFTECHFGKVVRWASRVSTVTRNSGSMRSSNRAVPNDSRERSGADGILTISLGWGVIACT